jgi:hypothetical protein
VRISHHPIALTAVAVVGVVIAVVISTSSPAPSRPASDPGVVGATTVQRRDLVATDTESGTLSYSGPQTVYDRLSGTITWLPSVGRVIRPGGTLYTVDGKPVILLNGSTPAYRTLSSADTDGADIMQLNRNLVDLGFNSDGIVIDDIWQPATTIGVELLQESLGETATGILSLGEVVFLPGAQLVSTVQAMLGAGGGSGTAAADARVAAGRPEFVSLRSAESTCPDSGASTTTSTTTTSCTTTTTTPPTTPTPTTGSTPTTTPTTTGPATHPPPNIGRPKPPRRGHRRRRPGQQALAALTALLKAESAQLKAATAELRAAAAAKGKGNGSATGGSPTSSSGSGSPTSSSGSGNSGGSSGSGGSGNGGSGSGGSGSNDGTAVLQTTSTHLVVTVDLSASSQSEAVVGERLTVEMPAGNTVNGRITTVSPVAESSSGSGNGSNSGSGGGGGSGNGNSGGSTSTIPVTITLSGHHTGAGLDQAAVSVNFAQQRARNVLSVPVTALLAVAGGNFAVQPAAKPHQLIPVSTGLFAAGYVQISGPGVYSGLQVTDSQG